MNNNAEQRPTDERYDDTADKPPYGNPWRTLQWWDPTEWGLSEWDAADAGAFEDAAEDGAEE